MATAKVTDADGRLEQPYFCEALNKNLLEDPKNPAWRFATDYCVNRRVVPGFTRVYDAARVRNPITRRLGLQIAEMEVVRERPGGRRGVRAAH